MIFHFVYFARLTGILFLEEKSAKTGTILVAEQQHTSYFSFLTQVPFSAQNMTPNCDTDFATKQQKLDNVQLCKTQI